MSTAPISPLFGLLLLLSFFFPTSSIAGGPAHGAKGAGMGTAFAAVADDPSAIAHNPAGIGFLPGTQLYLGVMAVAPETRFKADNGYREETESQIFAAPHGYLCSELGDGDVKLGLGLFSPFGIGGRTWPDDGIMQYFSKENLIATFMANPVVAWRLLPTLSIAFGIDYLWAYNKATQSVDQSMFMAKFGESSLTVDGDGWGWNVGLLWHVDPQFSIGAAYRSGIAVDLSGDIQLKNIAPALQQLFQGWEITSGAHSSIDFPEIVTLGIAWYPAHFWTVTVESEWVGWSSFQSQTITVDQPVAAAGFGDVEVIQDWQDTWIGKMGLERKIDPHWALRTGYAYLSSPVPATTLSPANPDGHQHNYCFGVGYTRERFTLDLFYVFAKYQDRQKTGNLLSGEYANQSHSLGFSTGWRF